MFLVPWIGYHSAYDEVVTRLKSSLDAKFLDVGCYIGHDLRALHLAGVPQASLFGLDIIDFLPLGNELFCDADRFDLNGQFLVGDILDSDSSSQAAQLLDGKMHIVWCSAILHQFPWYRAVRACQRLVQYSTGPGALIIGAIVGSSKTEGTADMKGLTKGRSTGPEAFKHNATSLERLWKEVGNTLNLNLRVTTNWKSWNAWGCDEERCKIMGDAYGVLEWTTTIL